MNDIPGRATISGTLTFSSGQDLENGSFVENFAPAAGVKVLVKLSNSSLDNTGTSQGYTTFETTTGPDGKYRFSIPVVDNGVSYIIAPQPFYGTRHTVDGFDENNNIKFKDTDVIYSISGISNTAYPGDIIIRDVMYGYKELNAVETFDKIETLKGKVGLAAYWRSSDNSTRREYWTAGKNVNLLVRVTYPYSEAVGSSYVSMVRTFGATTDLNGDFEVKIPVKNEGVTLPYIELLPVAYKTSFTNYYYNSSTYSYLSQDIEGVYKLFTGNYNSTLKGTYSNYTFQTIPGVPNAELKVVMIFEPLSTITDHNYNPSFTSSSIPWGKGEFI